MVDRSSANFKFPAEGEENTAIPAARNGLATKVIRQIEQTWAWQVYGVRAMQRKLTRVLLMFAGIGLWGLIGFGPSQATVPLPLSEMNRVTGELREFSAGWKSSSTLVVRAEKGHEYVLHGGLATKKKKTSLEAAVTRPVTVWYQKSYSAGHPFGYLHYWQVQAGDDLVVEHTSERQTTARRSYAAGSLWLTFFLGLFLVSLWAIWRICPNRATECGG